MATETERSWQARFPSMYKTEGKEGMKRACEQESGHLFSTRKHARLFHGLKDSLKLSSADAIAIKCSVELV